MERLEYLKTVRVHNTVILACADAAAAGYRNAVNNCCRLVMYSLAHARVQSRL
jgi:hypothetical protein